MYDDVRALLICWKRAQPTTFKHQRAALEKVLKTPYQFGTLPIDIPNQQPYDFLITHVGDFNRSYNKDNTLLILYYGGHGDVHDGELVLKW